MLFFAYIVPNEKTCFFPNAKGGHPNDKTCFSANAKGSNTNDKTLCFIPKGKGGLPNDKTCVLSPMEKEAIQMTKHVFFPQWRRSQSQ